MKQGLLEPASSEWASNVVLERKKKDARRNQERRDVANSDFVEGGSVISRPLHLLSTLQSEEKARAVNAFLQKDAVDGTVTMG